jgi:hypothetical protein
MSRIAYRVLAEQTESDRLTGCSYIHGPTRPNSVVIRKSAAQPTEIPSGEGDPNPETR